VLLAAEAARLAAQLGVTVPELTIPPTEIPLLASKLPDAIGISTSASLLKSIAGPIGGLCNSSAFENIGNSSALQSKLPDAIGVSTSASFLKSIAGPSGGLCNSSAFERMASFRQKAPLKSELFVTDPIPHFASGLGVGANLGSFPLPVDPLSMQAIRDHSNALLVAARAEVEQMMAQIAAQNASDALPHTPAQPCEQTLPAASLTPLPPPFSTSTLPAITAAASSLSFETSQRTTSSDAAANEGPSTISIFRENIPTAFRSTIRSVCK
jgi:hypothetical protein